jgi:hypothetical protein
MNCEIEFMPVGESSRAGDAIVVRYGELHDYKIMLIDGGTSATGEEIVLHLRKFFGADVEIEHMVLTHSDITPLAFVKCLRRSPSKTFGCTSPGCWLVRSSICLATSDGPRMAWSEISRKSMTFSPKSLIWLWRREGRPGTLRQVAAEIGKSETYTQMRFDPYMAGLVRIASVTSGQVSQADAPWRPSLLRSPMRRRGQPRNSLPRQC